MTDARPPQASEKPDRAWWLALGAILLVAAVLRVCNLGTFSLWLDEAFTMSRATLPFPEMIRAALADPDNAPLYLVITRLSLLVGLADPWLRLVPVASGLASIAVWSVWTRRGFGDRAGLMLAGFMALSTFHLRYSQELRSYPYLLLVTGLAMIAAERLRDRPSAGSTAAFAIVIAAGWYTHFSFAVVLVPAVGLVRAPDLPSPTPEHRRRTAVLLGVAVGLGTLAVVPWLLAIATDLPARLGRGATAWTLSTVGRRWEFLTVAPDDASTLSWLGLVLAVAAVAGLAVAAGHRFGRWVVLPAAAMVIVLEVVFLVVDRWSKARYATAVWPFLALLVVLGTDAAARYTRRRHLAAVLFAAVGLAMVVRVDAYHRRGRPHWDRMAAAIEEVRRPDEPVLVESEWITTCLPFYYPGELHSLRWSEERIHETLSGAPSALVVTSIHHADNPELRRLARGGALVAAIPSTGDLYRLRSDMVGRPRNDTTWPAPAGELVANQLEALPRGCLPGRVWPVPDADDTVRLSFNGDSRDVLRYGFTGSRVGTDGRGFALVIGPEAGVTIQRSQISAARLAVTVRPARGVPDQELRMVVNDHPLGAAHLRPGLQTVEFHAPASCWKPGRNLVVLQFRHLTAVRDGSKARAAAVHQIDLLAPAD